MIKIAFNAGGYPIKRSLAERVAKITNRLEKKISGELEVNIVGNKTIQKLNQEFRKKNQVTDVLSFAWREDKKLASAMLGQIFICYPRIKRQAKEFQVELKTEFIRMLAHGLLHLAGYDHGHPKEAKKMSTLQNKIVEEAQ